MTTANVALHIKKVRRTWLQYSDDFIDIVSNAVDEKKLIIAGSSLNGENLYFASKEMNKEFYEYYKKTRREYIERMQYEEGKKKEEAAFIDNFEKFEQVAPILLWKNPFGQWVRFTRVDFLVRGECG